MLGRGVKLVDWNAELRKQTHPTSISGMLADFDRGGLRQAVRDVVDSELTATPRYPSRDEVFHRRFATTKAGSHTAASSRVAKEFMSDMKLSQPTRRNFMEAVHSNFLLRTAPGASVSKSEKLEHGKSRALYACDSIHYFHFDAPCTEIERCWANNRAILQPAGTSDYSDFKQRGRSFRKYKIMLDFEDFNSAHTTEAQTNVVSELFRGLDEAWLSWLVDSFDNMRITMPCGDELHVAGTLMSGHRMTTIINTVLNAAYMRVILGSDLYNKCCICHVGDDILISTDSSDDAALVVDRALSSSLRFQRSKQSFGTLCAEFVRISFNRSVGVGYFCRAVSGSWVNDYILNKRDYINSILRVLWNLHNRSAMHGFSVNLFRSTIHR